MDLDHDVREAMRRVRLSMARMRPGEAEDIVQETMLRAVRKGIALDAEPWLRTVAKRVAIDNSRRDREIASGGSAELELMARSEVSPEDQVLTREAVGAVRDALGTLPPRYRDALIAYVEEDESAAGVARRFGLSDGATWTLLCRARARLRTELERVGYAIFIFVQRFGGSGDSETAGKGAAIAAAAIAALAIGGAAVDTEPRAPSPPERVISSAPATSNAHTPEPTVGSSPEAVGSSDQRMDTDAAPEVEVPEAPTKLAQYQVGTCLLSPDDEPVGVGLSIEDTDEQRSLVGGLLQKLPEPLRYQERDIVCWDD